MTDTSSTDTSSTDTSSTDTSSTDTAQRHRISGPEELVQAVPYLLGFHPRHSVVLVGLADRLLTVTARLDLADADVGQVLHGTMTAMARAGTAALVAVVYAAAPGDRHRWSALASRVLAEADRCGLECDDVLLVTRGRWRSVLCTAPQCCPPEGRTVHESVSAFAAAATVAGVVPLRDRESLAQTLASRPERQVAQPLLTAAGRAADRARGDGSSSSWERAVKRRLFATARNLTAGGDGVPEDAGPGAVDEETAAAFAVALREVPVRDAIWLAVDGGRLDGRELWSDLARRLPAPYDAVPLFLHGWASWRAGNGALASIAVERAVVSDPECTPALLLRAAIDQAVDPRRMPKLRLPRLPRPARTA